MTLQYNESVDCSASASIKQCLLSEDEKVKPVTSQVLCPSCQSEELELSSYDSMMVVGADVAVFTLTCPHCQSSVQVMRPIPESLLSDVRAAAALVKAGMGAE